MIGYIVDKEIEKLKEKGYSDIEIKTGFYDIDDFFETSAGSEIRHDLGNSVLIVTGLSVHGLFNVSALNNKTFLKLQSKRELLDYSSLFEVNQNGVYVEVKSDFVSIHYNFFIVKYNLTTFIESNPLNIFKGSVEYIQIIPTK